MSNQLFFFYYLVTRDKKSDILKKQSLRNVYVCHVIGEKGSGKSSLCQTHIGHTLKVYFNPN